MNHDHGMNGDMHDMGDMSDMNNMGDMNDMSGMNDMMNEMADDPFCSGNMGMVMYMEGFRWTLQGGHSCINLYFSGWTLDTRGKVIGAMVGVLLLAMMTEAISKLRHSLSIKQRVVTISSSERKKFSVFQTLLHGLHAFTGYTVMLATMTFSLELLICVISGLTFGYALFGGDKYGHVSTNPCCQFLEDEAVEREEAAAAAETQNPTQDCCNNANDGLETELNFSETGDP